MITYRRWKKPLPVYCKVIKVSRVQVGSAKMFLLTAYHLVRENSGPLLWRDWIHGIFSNKLGGGVSQTFATWEWSSTTVLKQGTRTKISTSDWTRSQFWDKEHKRLLNCIKPVCLATHIIIYLFISNPIFEYAFVNVSNYLHVQVMYIGNPAHVHNLNTFSENIFGTPCNSQVWKLTLIVNKVACNQVIVLKHLY